MPTVLAKNWQNQLKIEAGSSLSKHLLGKLLSISVYIHALCTTEIGEQIRMGSTFSVVSMLMNVCDKVYVIQISGNLFPTMEENLSYY